MTLQFFKEVEKGNFDIYISQIVFDEIEKASGEKRKALKALIGKFTPKELEITEEILLLADKYIIEAALPKRAIDDSIHAAIATVNEMDALISWNLKHLANLRRKDKICGINLKEGYSKRLEIITPMEVSSDEEI
jgi:predicted subunit of tRNA(5-methylaminomethyl-2-thiouridylate) methyltransferase